MYHTQHPLHANPLPSQVGNNHDSPEPEFMTGIWSYNGRVQRNPLMLLRVNYFPASTVRVIFRARSHLPQKYGFCEGDCPEEVCMYVHTPHKQGKLVLCFALCQMRMINMSV